ncbi:MAG: tail fiber domain-containing protein [Gemmatimonadales bacterium]
MTSMARTTTATTPLCLVVGMLSLAGTARAQSPLFEVEKGDATKLLQVTDDGGFLVRGALDVGTIPASGPGVRLMWYPGRAAFRAGGANSSQWDDGSIGSGSVALGLNTKATGGSSLALNSNTEASGTNSIAGGVASIASGQTSLAVGYSALASGNEAVALGRSTFASGDHSFAAGSRTKATGNASMATGTGTVAAGTSSVALGTGVTAQGRGSFAFGDRNTQFPVTAGPNEFLVRAFGGIGLNTGVNIGCDLPAGTGAWACTSSKLVKEEFEEVDGEDLLARLKGVPIQRWRYLGTSARHLGPFAEDFQAAFGLGDSPTKIAQIDADGVALRAVQALEQRTAELRAENAALRAETTELRRRVEALESSGRER